jgi:hypothetical protein
MNLSADVLKELSKPFPASEIKLKIQAKLKSDPNKAIIVAYIDARAVMERLDEVAGGEWEDSYSSVVLAGKNGTECRLTIFGVTRSDVGDPESDGMDNSLKSSYSDAFKRAAVKFGIGRFLYAIPKMYAKTEGNQISRDELPRLQAVLESHLTNTEVWKIMAGVETVAQKRTWSKELTEALSLRALDKGLEAISVEDAVELLDLSNMPDTVTPKAVQSWFEHYVNSAGTTPADKAQDANNAYTQAKLKSGGK